MLVTALEAEIADYIALYAEERDSNGNRLVVRNGHCPERDI